MTRFALLLIFISFQLKAQKVDDTLLARAKSLSKEYKDNSVLALTSRSVYEFFIDKKAETLYASHDENIRYLALRSNSSFVKRNYYNDKSWIEAYTMKSDRGKNYDHDKFCGHYQSGDIFYSDAQICAYRFYMSLQGQAVDFYARTIYSDPRYLTKIFFHNDVPVEHREIVIKVPAWADIELLEMNFDGYTIHKEVSKGEVTTFTYTFDDMKAFPEDENDPGYLHYLPHILVLTKSYIKGGVKVPVLASTDDLYAWYHTLTSQLKFNTGEINAKVKELTGGLTSDIEKIEAVYYWVQDNIRYIAFEDGLAAYKPEDADKVFYNRYGDCKGMANLTKTMLKLADFDARLTWIGTDRIPYTYDIPSLAVDNHMICTVYAGGKQYILDPTEKYNPLGHHAERIQGKQILIENGASYRIDTVSEEALDNYLCESKWDFKIEGGHLEGKGRYQIDGEYKKDILNFIYKLSDEDVNKFLRAVISGNSDPDHFNIENYSKPDRTTPLAITYDMELENVNSFDKELYVDLDFTQEFKGAELKKERHIPYHFGRKEYSRTVAEMIIPQGYKVNHLPEPYHIENEYFKFDLKYEKAKGKIIYTKEIKLFKNTLPIAAFETWNTSVSNLTKFYNDQIILKADE